MLRKLNSRLPLLLSLLLMSSVALAETAPSEMTIKPAFNVRCADLTGTWQGSFIDPTLLFGDGGPWPITLSLYSKGNKVVGIAQAGQAGDGINKAASGKFYAQCNKGVLSQIYLARNTQCGHFSSSGVLAGQNMLILYLPYENAMIGTDFLVSLTRTSDKYSGVIPSAKAMQMPKVETCH